MLNLFYYVTLLQPYSICNCGLAYTKNTRSAFIRRLLSQKLVSRKSRHLKNKTGMKNIWFLIETYTMSIVFEQRNSKKQFHVYANICGASRGRLSTLKVHLSLVHFNIQYRMHIYFYAGIKVCTHDCDGEEFSHHIISNVKMACGTEPWPK